MTALDSQLLEKARQFLADDDEDLMASARALMAGDGGQQYAPVPPGTRAGLAPTLAGAVDDPGAGGVLSSPSASFVNAFDRRPSGIVLDNDLQIEAQAARLMRRDELAGLVDRTLTRLPGEPEPAFVARKMSELNRLAQREGLPTGRLPDAIDPQYGGFEAAGRSLVRGGLGVADAFSGQALQALGSGQQALTEGIAGVLDPAAVDIARQIDTPAKRMIEAGRGVSGAIEGVRETFQPSHVVAAQGGLPDSLGQTGGFLLERAPEAIASLLPTVAGGLVAGPVGAMAAGGLQEGLSGFGEAEKAAQEAASNPNLSPVQRRELLARARNEALVERTVYGVIATLLEKLPAEQLFAPATVGKIRRIVGTAAAEGGTESLQSASEQIIAQVTGQPTDTTLAQGIENALGEGLLGLVAGGTVAAGVGGRGGANERNKDLLSMREPGPFGAAVLPGVPREVPSGVEKDASSQRGGASQGERAIVREVIQEAGQVGEDSLRTMRESEQRDASSRLRQASGDTVDVSGMPLGTPSTGIPPEFFDTLDAALESGVLTPDEVLRDPLLDRMTDAEQAEVVARVEAFTSRPAAEPVAEPAQAPEPERPATSRAVGRKSWELTYQELRDAVAPYTKEDLEAARPILRELYSEWVGDAADPWGIDRAVTRGDEFPRVPVADLSVRHRRAIRAAIAAGETIPARVLADYPDLAQPATPSTDTVESAEPSIEPAAAPVAPESVATPDSATLPTGAIEPSGAAVEGGAASEQDTPPKPVKKPKGRRKAPTVKSIGPKPLTTAQIDDRLSSIASERGLVRDVDAAELEASGRTGDAVEFSTRFGGKIPAEVLEAIEDAPQLKRKLQANDPRGGGEDALNALGVDEYVRQLRQSGKTGATDAALEALRDSGDPQIDLLIRARDARSNGEKLSRRSGDTLKPGDSFAIGEETYGVIEGPDGLQLVDTDGATIEIGDGGSLLDTVPFRAGTYVEGGEQGVADAQARIDKRAAGREDTLDFLDRMGRGEASLRKAADQFRERVKNRKAPRPDAPFSGRSGATILIPNLVDTVVAELLEIAADGLAITRAVLEARLSKVIDDPKALKEGVWIAERIVKRSFKNTDKLNPTLSGPKLRKAAQAEYKRAVLADLRSKLKGTKQVGRARIAETRQAERRKAAVRLDELRKRLTDKAKATAAERKAIRNEVVALVNKYLPPAERGRYLKAAAVTATNKQLTRVVARLNRQLARSIGRASIRQVRRLTTKRRLGQLNPDRRDTAQTARETAETAYFDLKQKGVPAHKMMQHAQAIVDAENTIRQLLADERNERTVIVDGLRKGAQMTRELIVDTVGKIDPAGARTRGKADDAPGRMEVSFGRRFFGKQIAPQSLALRLDNDQDNGIVERTLHKPLVAAERKKQELFLADIDRVDKAARKAGFANMLDAAQQISGITGPQDQITLPIALGRFNRITLGQAMHLYAMDPDTKARYLSGKTPGKFEGDPAGATFPVDGGVLEAAERALSPEQKQLVDDIKETIDRHWPEIELILRELKGRSPEKVAGYFPRKVERESAPPEPEGYRQIGQRWAEDVGFGIERVGPGGNPVIIGDFLNIALGHLQQVAHMRAFAQPIRTAANLYMARDVQTAIADKLGTAAAERVKDIIRRAAVPDQYVRKGWFDRVANAGIQNVGRALTQLNEATWVRQLAGLAPLAAVMPKDAYTKGLKGLTHKAPADMMRDPSVVTRYAGPTQRLFSGVDDGVAVLDNKSVGLIVASAKRAVLGGKPAQVFRGVFSVLPRVADRLRITAVFDRIPYRVAWAGAEYLVDRDSPGLSPDERLDRIGALADSWIRQSQNGYDDMDVGEIIGSDARENVLLRALAAFKSDANKQFNILYRAYRRGGGYRSKEFARAASLIGANAVWNGLVTGAVGTALWGAVGSLFGTGDDDEKRRDEALTSAGWAFLQSTGGLVYGGDLLVNVIEGYFRGFDTALFETPVGGQIDTIGEGGTAAFNGFADLFNSEIPLDERWDKAADKFMTAMYKLAYGGTALAGYPLPPAMSRVRRAYRSAVYVAQAKDIAGRIDDGEQDRAVEMATNAIWSAGETKERTKKAASLRAAASRYAKKQPKDQQADYERRFLRAINAGRREASRRAAAERRTE